MASDGFQQQPISGEYYRLDTFDNQDFAHKQKELMELGELRVTTLENIISEKHKQLAEVQQELDEFANQNQELTEQLLQKASLIEQYEEKFEQVRQVVHDKEVKVSDLLSQIASLTSKIEIQQTQIQSYQAKQLVAEDQIRSMKADLVDRLQVKEQDTANRFEKQLAIVTK